MCFSTEVSFISSAVLAVMGGLCLKKARGMHHYFLLSLTPFFFALQQLSEGFVWYGLSHANAHLMHIFSIIYLFFAFFFWIVWFPLIAYTLESIPWRKNGFFCLILFSIVFGLYLWLPVLWEEGPGRLLNTTVCERSLCYHVADGGFLMIPAREAIYLLLGLLCLLCSDVVFKRFWILVMVLAVITKITYVYAQISVWCFFSALLSVLILYFMNKKLLD